MSESTFKIIPQDRHAVTFHVYRDGVLLEQSHLLPSGIAGSLLDRGIAVRSDRIEYCNSRHFPLLDYSVAGLAAYENSRVEKTLRKNTKQTEIRP